MLVPIVVVRCVANCYSPFTLPYWCVKNVYLPVLLSWVGVAGSVVHHVLISRCMALLRTRLGGCFILLINNNNNHDNVMALLSWPKLLWEFTRFIWWMQTKRRVAANPKTKPIDLGCEFAENWLLPSTPTIPIVIITQPVGWYSFYRPTEGGRLSRPRHCSKGAQPVPKVYIAAALLINSLQSS